MFACILCGGWSASYFLYLDLTPFYGERCNTRSGLGDLTCRSFCCRHDWDRFLLVESLFATRIFGTRVGLGWMCFLRFGYSVRPARVYRRFHKRLILYAVIEVSYAYPNWSYAPYCYELFSFWKTPLLTGPVPSLHHSTDAVLYFALSIFFFPLTFSR